MMLDSSLTICGLCGSLRENSHTHRALSIALEGAAELGARTELIDLRTFDLIFCRGRMSDADAPPGVMELRHALRDAQGIILGTPEYHGSISGVLKNALDLTGFQEFEGKMIGLIGVSGGRLGAINALNDLRNVGRSLHAWVIPEQVSLPEAYRLFDAQGRLSDERLLQRLKDVGRQVARFAYLHSSERAMDFIREWERAQANPGGR